VSGNERTESSINWGKLATATETIVFLMNVANLPFIAEQLMKHGRSPGTPVAIIRSGTLIEQESLTGTLKDIVQKVEEARFDSPAILIVGEVVRLRDTLSWFEKKPLFGKRVLVTRALSQSRVLSEKIQELGGEPLEFPVIRIVRPKRQDLLDEALLQLKRYDWVIFTSANGVKFFFERLKELKLDIRTMHKARIAAIGPKTAETLEEKGLIVEALPDEYKAEALVEHLRPLVKAGEEVLLPRANIARKVLADELVKMGLRVTEVDAYDTEIGAEDVSEVLRLLEDGALHVITFTSSSTVRNFVEAVRTVREDVEALLEKTKVVCIGPITAGTARELGVRVDAVADTYTIDGLVEAIRRLP
jgi:uroporphyrinogen III methyltransferase/synthase